VAWEEGIAIDLDLEHQQRQLLAEYKNKLTAKGTVLPDPLSVKDGWLTEQQGMPYWPQLYFSDITEYLRHQTPADLYHRVCNEYKEGKAYRYESFFQD